MVAETLSQLAIVGEIPPEDRDFLATFYRLDAGADWRLYFANGVYTLKYVAHCVEKGTENITDSHAKNLSQSLSLTLDFRVGNYRHRQNNPSKEPLAQAVKVKKKLPKTLIDATPGVLKDSLMLASRGVQITAIERNPLLFVIVRRALAALPEPPSINYLFGDATEALHVHSAAVIYLDPMYPPPASESGKKKSAQVKKDMQVLHHIVGADADADQLLQVARQQNSRVVVKRPSYAEPLAQEQPSFVSQTGATRFDVYLP